MSETYPIPTALIASALYPGWQSCMNVTTEYAPIAESANIVRTWNGTAVNLTAPQFRLYRVTLSCDEDLVPPALAHLWPGERFSLVPAEEWSEPTTKPQQRAAHTGTTRIVDAHFVAGTSGRRLYRPVLDLVVTEPWRVSVNERTKLHSWQLVAEEYAHPSLGA